MASEETLHPLNLDGKTWGTKWHGYHVELIGTQTNNSTDQTLSYYQAVTASGKERCLLLLTQRIRYKDSPVYGEITWHPEIGFSLAIKGIEHATDEAMVLKAWQGLKLLSKAKWQGKGVPPSLKTEGRPKGSGLLADLPPDDFREKYADLRETYEYRGMKLPTQVDMADHLNVKRTTLYRYLKKHGIKWPPLGPPED
jgi:hypothetical protein